MPESAAPMGRIDALDVGSRKLTVQTEYFDRPAPRIETKIYIGGALKKIYTDELTGDVGDLQKRLHSAHEARMKEIVASLQGLGSK
ncbi:MAG TPA: hypothetical protein VGF40_07845 [Thermoanaerobaculia bacterium]